MRIPFERTGFWMCMVILVTIASGQKKIMHPKSVASVKNGPMLETSQSPPGAPCCTSINIWPWTCCFYTFLQWLSLTKNINMNQHSTSLLRWFFFGFASLFSKICSFSEVPFYGPVLQCAATISSTQKVLNRAQPGVSWATKKKRPNFPLNHLLVNRDSCNGLWRNPHIRVV